MRSSVMKHVLSLPNLSIEDEVKPISIEPGIKNKCPYVPSPQCQSVDTPSLSFDYLLKDTFSERRELKLIQFGNKFYNDNRYKTETAHHYTKQIQHPKGTTGTKKKYRSCNHDPRKHEKDIITEIERNSGDILSQVRDPLTVKRISRRNVIKNISPVIEEPHKGMISMFVLSFSIIVIINYLYINLQ